MRNHHTLTRSHPFSLFYLCNTSGVSDLGIYPLQILLSEAECWALEIPNFHSRNPPAALSSGRSWHILALWGPQFFGIIADQGRQICNYIHLHLEIIFNAARKLLSLLPVRFGQMHIWNIHILIVAVEKLFAVPYLNDQKMDTIRWQAKL